MVHASSAARRYAEAYFDLARDAGDIAEWRRQLEHVVQALTPDTIAGALANPKLALSRRVQMGLALIDGVAMPARNLARLLIERRRVSIVSEILAHYDVLSDAESGVVRAEVRTAVPVDDRLRASIERALAERLGPGVRTNVVHDPAIVGGLVIRIGDRVIDDSVQTHLQQLQAALA